MVELPVLVPRELIIKGPRAALKLAVELLVAQLIPQVADEGDLRLGLKLAALADELHARLLRLDLVVVLLVIFQTVQAVVLPTGGGRGCCSCSLGIGVQKLGHRLRKAVQELLLLMLGCKKVILHV